MQEEQLLLEVWVARHGQRIDFIDFEWEKTAPRPFDPFLSPHGEKQATETGRHLKSINSGIQHIVRFVSHKREHSIHIHIHTLYYTLYYTLDVPY
jgi:hypothetical protein